MGRPVARTTIGIAVALALLTPALGLARAARATPASGAYTVTDLGVLPGGTASQANAVNAAAQVVGWLLTTAGGGAMHAFLWERGAMADLGTLPGYTDSVASGLNDGGWVVGHASVRPNPATGAERLDRAVLWRGGTPLDLGTLGGQDSRAHAVNDAGQVVGYAYTAHGSARAFLWSADTGMADLGTLPGDSDSVAIGINDRGQVVGYSYSPQVPDRKRAFLWQGGAMTELPALGGASSAAYGINAAGQVAGWARPASGPERPVLWAGGTPTDLRPGGGYGEALGLNDAGQVVGTPAFLWQGGAATDLNTLLPAGSGWSLFDARAVNRGGQIVGQGSRAGQTRAYLLTPPADTTPPTTTVTLSPALNAAGWSAAPITVTLSATDDSGPGEVRQLTYRAAGAQPIPSTLAGGASVTLTIAAEGRTTLSYFATDAAGNAEAPWAVTVGVDTTPPTIAGSRDPAPGASGWDNGDVRVGFACSDALSGVVNCPTPTILTAEGANQSATDTASDLAGNTATATVGGINIDKTAPAVGYNGNAGTYDVDESVTISCSATDALAGVAATTCRDVSAPAYTFPLGTTTLSATATDRAGNVGSGAASFTVRATYGGLCRLTTRFVTEGGVARALCAKLQVAEAAAARGSAWAAAGALGAYQNEVAAQRGKSLTAEQAAILARLAGTIMPSER